MDAIIILNAFSFLFYGSTCLFSQHMVDEFNRYGTPRYRILVGLLEVAAAIGLMLGYVFPTLQKLSAAGLALLMLCGCVLRIKIRDSFKQVLPAFLFFVLNIVILFHLS